MGSPRQTLSFATLGISEIVRSQKKKKEKAEFKREIETQAAAEAEEKRLKEVAEAVPTLQDVEVEDAARRVRRRIQKAFGRRKTILTPRRQALGAEPVGLGTRPIGRPVLGGF